MITIIVIGNNITEVDKSPLPPTEVSPELDAGVREHSHTARMVVLVIFVSVTKRRRYRTYLFARVPQFNSSTEYRIKVPVGGG